MPLWGKALPSWKAYGSAGTEPPFEMPRIYAKKLGESMTAKLLEKVLSKKPTQNELKAIGYYLDKMMRRNSN